MGIAAGLVLIESRGQDRLCKTEAASEKTPPHQRSEPFARTTQQAKDRASIIAPEIHRPIETFLSQRPKDWPHGQPLGCSL